VNHEQGTTKFEGRMNNDLPHFNMLSDHEDGALNKEG